MQWWVALYKHIYVCKHLGNSSLQGFCCCYLVCMGKWCMNVCVLYHAHGDQRTALWKAFLFFCFVEALFWCCCHTVYSQLAPSPSLPFIWTQQCPAFYVGSRIKLQPSGSSVKRFYLGSHPPTLPPWGSFKGAAPDCEQRFLMGVRVEFGDVVDMQKKPHFTFS